MISRLWGHPSHRLRNLSQQIEKWPIWIQEFFAHANSWTTHIWRTAAVTNKYRINHFVSRVRWRPAQGWPSLYPTRWRSLFECAITVCRRDDPLFEAEKSGASLTSSRVGFRMTSSMPRSICRYQRRHHSFENGHPNNSKNASALALLPSSFSARWSSVECPTSQDPSQWSQARARSGAEDLRGGCGELNCCKRNKNNACSSVRVVFGSRLAQTLRLVTVQ